MTMLEINRINIEKLDLLKVMAETVKANAEAVCSIINKIDEVKSSINIDDYIECGQCLELCCDDDFSDIEEYDDCLDCDDCCECCCDEEFELDCSDDIDCDDNEETFSTSEMIDILIKNPTLEAVDQHDYTVRIVDRQFIDENLEYPQIHIDDRWTIKKD